jgi:hypothetical protein
MRHYLKTFLMFPILTMIFLSSNSHGQFGGLLNNLKIPESITNKANELINPNKQESQRSTDTSAPIANNQYPLILQGSYVYLDGDINQLCQSNQALKINASERLDDVDRLCKPISVTLSNGKYSVRESCSREGRSDSQTTQFEIQGSNLQLTEPPNKVLLRKCSAMAPPPPSAPAPAAVNNSTQKCKVSSGYAGVTTFLDEQLKKSGTGPIRDFDTVEFWVEKTVTVRKDKVLVGKLYDTYLSKVIEAKSFAIADEWTCQ